MTESSAMPELNWIGKAAVVKHQPFRLLKTDSTLSCGDSQRENIIFKQTPYALDI